jgi:hypothetical protein
MGITSRQSKPTIVRHRIGDQGTTLVELAIRSIVGGITIT